MKVRLDRLQRTIHEEGGAALAITLVLLVIGGLIMAPLLGHMGTGTLAGAVHEKKTDQLYLADAGIEYAIWHLQTGGSYDETLELDNLEDTRVVSVDIDIEPLGSPCDNRFEILSTAMSSDGTSTTVKTVVTDITVRWEGDETGPRRTIYGNVYVEEGGLTVNRETYITGNVIIDDGDMSLDHLATVGGTICVKNGSLTVNQGGAVVEGNVFIKNGDLQLNSAVTIKGDVHVIGGEDANGDVVLSGGARIEGSVYSTGSVEMTGGPNHGTTIVGDLWAGGSSVFVDANPTVGGTVHVAAETSVTGVPFVRDFDPARVLECDIEFGPAKVLLYEIS